MSRNEQTITDATRRVTHWMIGIRGEVPLVEELATAGMSRALSVAMSVGSIARQVQLLSLRISTGQRSIGAVLKLMHVAL